jgi:putative transposase
VIDQIATGAEKADEGVALVARMCDLLGVSRSGYYAWQARQQAGPGPRAARRADLAVKIRVAHDASDGVNGAPRITADLREAGEHVSTKTVAKLMRQERIQGISPRPWRPVTTITDPAADHIPDLVERRFDQGPAQHGVDLRHYLSEDGRGLALSRCSS